MIKVLVVDDSKVAREMITHILTADPGIKVIGTAADGYRALAAMERQQPDVVTMDVHMPGLDGFATTREIMREHPVPVVIVTGTLDPKADTAVFRTLEAGALAIILKPPGFGHPDHARAAAELLQTVRLMSEVKVVRRSYRESRLPSPVKPEVTAPPKLVAVGASTGGPVIVKNIISSLPASFPFPVLVVQHMAGEFLAGYAEWLAGACELTVKLGEPGETVKGGSVYIAPGGADMGLDGRGRIVLTPGAPGQLLCPSVNHLFRSVAIQCGRHAVGILLTGMGNDGAAGLKEMRDEGALTIVQDEESSVIFGMPAEAIRIGGARQVLSPGNIVALLKGLAGRLV
ncbi:chemotaxis-specific protein-glutamate methyltransferase CheB [Geomonas sp. Red32]|uniref:chemotaxis-specific protein-glutamate methyltransferase CheB n=1 Tax=Geomonas sp. Red32 TaxID=2912856 RepID=UPI00202CD1DA|nr:chemotaxis-specific protein-glutamate methyltransferase CheB [Geomonas sp. Red32]MCM0083294.1 chemotaxis-specific protein-glutamate methyltransferase CheB [Geomonas sp. Red32]